MAAWKALGMVTSPGDFPGSPRPQVVEIDGEDMATAAMHATLALNEGYETVEMLYIVRDGTPAWVGIALRGIVLGSQAVVVAVDEQTALSAAQAAVAKLNAQESGEGEVWVASAVKVG